MNDDNDDDDRLTTGTYHRYGSVLVITSTLILANIAAFTNFTSYEVSTVYVNRDIEGTLTRDKIIDTLQPDERFPLHFIDVKDYGCRKNNSVLNNAVLRGNFCPSESTLTSSPTRIFAEDLTVAFCTNVTGFNPPYLVSMQFSSGCNDDVARTCHANSPCKIKVTRYLPLCQLCDSDITLEWHTQLKIRDAKNRTIVIDLFRSRSILKRTTSVRTSSMDYV